MNELCQCYYSSLKMVWSYKVLELALVGSDITGRACLGNEWITMLFVAELRLESIG